MKTSKIIVGLTVVPALLLSFTTTPIFAVDNTATPSVTGLADKATKLSESSLKELNINSATPEMLAAIPGIGPQISEGIAKYREANGAFTDIKDLLNVEGIDMALLEKIKPYLKL